eukprot:scaffold305225_cov43-Prasinocladus_malaysianus.AAC.1
MGLYEGLNLVRFITPASFRIVGGRGSSAVCLFKDAYLFGRRCLTLFYCLTFALPLYYNSDDNHPKSHQSQETVYAGIEQVMRMAAA